MNGSAAYGMPARPVEACAAHDAEQDRLRLIVGLVTEGDARGAPAHGQRLESGQARVAGRLLQRRAATRRRDVYRQSVPQ